MKGSDRVAFVMNNGLLQFDREATIEELIERDGLRCKYEGCTLPFDEDPNGKHSVSLDHIYPQIRCKEDGWTYEEIWSTENLQLMGRSCNAKKGDLVYDENGRLPFRSFKDRTVKAPRPDHCGLCENGRLLLAGENCPVCHSGPQPRSWPKYAQKTPKECSHGWTVPEDHCWMCVVGHIERAPASRTVFGVKE